MSWNGIGADREGTSDLNNAKDRAMDVYARLTALGYELPPPVIRPANWSLLPWQTHGDLLFVSGHGPRISDKVAYNGRLGADMTLEDGVKAAELCALNLLSTAHDALGDLNRIQRVTKVFGMVKCTSDFHQQPEVINGASELFVNLFGERGRHARTAVGMYDLPRGISVEIEMILAFQ